MFPLPRLSFHVNEDAATFLLALEGTDLDDSDRTHLWNFLDIIGEIEAVPRRHALLGQLFLKDELCMQSNPVFVIAAKTFDGAIQDTLAQVQRNVAPILDSFQEFQDLQDDDHDSG